MAYKTKNEGLCEALGKGAIEIGLTGDDGSVYVLTVGTVEDTLLAVGDEVLATVEAALERQAQR